MGKSKYEIKSKVVIPKTKESFLQELDRMSNISTKSKRSRSEGDDFELEKTKFKKHRSRSPKSSSPLQLRVEVEEDSDGYQELSDEDIDLREKLNRNKKDLHQRSSVTPKGVKTKQPMARKQLLRDFNEMETSESETEKEVSTTDDESDYENFRQNGGKFNIERKDLSSQKARNTHERELKEFMNYGEQETGSEINFKKPAKGKSSPKEDKRKRTWRKEEKRIKKKKREARKRKKKDKKSKKHHKKGKRSKSLDTDSSNSESSTDLEPEADNTAMVKLITEVVEKINTIKSKGMPNELLNNLIQGNQQIVTEKLKGEQACNKSPSESILYVPAVQKGVERYPKDRFLYNNSATPSMVTGQAKQQIAVNKALSEGSKPRTNNEDQELINQFLTSIRLGGDAKSTKSPNSSKSDKTKKMSAIQELENSRQAYAKEIADKAIIEAEQHKAAIEQPKGTCQPNIDIRMFDNDDDFFHTLCHIDQHLINKIQKYEFIELVKMLQKPQHLDMNNDEGRLNIVTRDGEDFLVRNKTSSDKITGIRKWDQAFCLYAAIYCQAHPERAVEMLQYSDIINQATTQFSWDRVARYDYVFCQLMAKKPYRSWAKTYTQGWTLILSAGEGSSNNKVSNRTGRISPNDNKKKARDWRDNCCWKFNRLDQCRYGKNCRYDHRCMYCGAYGHPSCTCTKKRKSSFHNDSQDEHYAKKSKRHHHRSSSTTETKSADSDRH